MTQQALPTATAADTRSSRVRRREPNLTTGRFGRARDYINPWTVPAEELPGWCLQFRVRVYGYAGQPVPELIQREDLDCAVQHLRIYGHLWKQTGGLGTAYGAPGRETFDAIRMARLRNRKDASAH